MTSPVLSSLMNRRSEIAERIAEKRAEARALVVTLEHVDATIREMFPGTRLDSVDHKARPETWAGRGEALREILNIMRVADRPMTLREITKELMHQRGMSVKDQRVVRIVNKRVGATLRAQRDSGRVVPTKKAGQMQLWEISRQ